MLSAPEFRSKQIIFALLSHGDRLSFSNDNIVIKNKDGEIKHQSTCYRLFALFIVGHVSITSGLLQRAKKFGFSLYLLTHNLSNYGAWNAAAEGNVLLRQKQYAYTGLGLAKHIIDNKIRSQTAMLQQTRNKSGGDKETIQSLNQYRSQLQQPDLDLQAILGVEGIASRVYFARLFADMDWRGRKPRVKHDITNVLLDMGYTQLFNLVDALLNLYGFDVYKGVYHQVFYQRKSLTCDLVEPFRPIVDKQIKNAYNLGQVKVEDFDQRQGKFFILPAAAKPYTTMLLQSILHHKESIFLYVQQYYRAFMRGKPVGEYPTFEFSHANRRL